MNFAFKTDDGDYAPTDETRTVKEASRIVCGAITMWLASGKACPNMDWTDGVSIAEAALGLDS